jgi:uncharacterized protein YjbI with pentapeptide repeats
VSKAHSGTYSRYAIRLMLRGVRLIMRLLRKSGALIMEYVPPLRAVTFEGCDLTDAVLRGEDLSGAHFEGLRLVGADLSHSILYWAYLFEANLCRADLSYSDMRGADLKNANLCGATLAGANMMQDRAGGPTLLHGANLEGCDLTGARLDYAEYTRATRFPAGFDPVASQMVKVD